MGKIPDGRRETAHAACSDVSHARRRRAIPQKSGKQALAGKPLRLKIFDFASRAVFSLPERSCAFLRNKEQ